MNRFAVVFLTAAWLLGACGDGDDTAVDTAPTVDLCASVSCGQDATCLGGSCVCDAGFAQDPSGSCVATDACWFVECGNHSRCEAGECLCDAGYEANDAGSYELQVEVND